MHSTPPAVRILPMDSKDEAGFVDRTAEEIQHQFFLTELVRPDRSPGRYCYHKLGLRAEPGTVVLFQYGGRIIASAVLLSVEHFDAPEPGDHSGALHFDVRTVKVFDPVDAATIGRIWPQVTRLGQAKWSLDPKRYMQFEQQLTGVERPSI